MPRAGAPPRPARRPHPEHRHRQVPGSHPDLGLFHAREHLHDLARSLEFMLGDQKDAWLDARLEALDYGDIDGICQAARHYPLEGARKTELDTAGYFENNAPRMRCHWFRRCGLFVGSGVVEASCKSVPGQRLKQSGMHWTVSGADAIIALRCQEGQQPVGSHLQQAAHSDADRLIRSVPKMILLTYKIDAQCATNAERSPPCRQVSFS